MTKLLQNYPKSSTSSLGTIATSSVSSVPVMYQNANGIYVNANGTPLTSLQTVSSVGVSSLSSSSFNQEHELDDLLAEWANMTGFLSALSSISLPSKQQHQPYHHPYPGNVVSGNGGVNSVGSTPTSSTTSIVTASTSVSSCALKSGPGSR